MTFWLYILNPDHALENLTLQQNFKGKGAFCGGVDAQELLVNGSPDQISKRVQEIKQVFPTGLVVSPSHEAILPDINPANIEAMFDSIKQ